MSSNVGSPPPYDLLLPVGPGAAHLARISIESLRRFLNPRRIYVVAGTRTLDSIRAWKDPGLHLLDEDSMVPGVTLERLRKMQREAGRNPERAGWYLQQFVKLGMSLRDDVLEHYLAWDADTVLLRPIDLFAPDGRVLITSSRVPVLRFYRGLYETLLGEPFPPGMSCVREQMMFRKSWVLGMLHRIEAVGGQGETWPLRIMNEAIRVSYPGQWEDFLRRGMFEDYGGIWEFGFSEYETYAAYLRIHHPEDFVLRELQSERLGARRFGLRPSRFDLAYLARRFDTVSFEAWSHMNRWRIGRNKWRALKLAIKNG